VAGSIGGHSLGWKGAPNAQKAAAEIFRGATFVSYLFETA